jgi:aldehyde dehydrogenase (NAD+)
MSQFGTVFSRPFDTQVFSQKVEFPTGVFINNEFRKGVDGAEIECVVCFALVSFALTFHVRVFNPSTGKIIATVSEARAADVNLAVQAARKAFETTWGLKTPGSTRGLLLNKLADIMEANADELAALESLDNGMSTKLSCVSILRNVCVGKTYSWSRGTDVAESIKTIRYYAGWADKVQGKTIETSEAKLCYTRHEPVGVVGQIIPWNFPRMFISLTLSFRLGQVNTP